MLHPDITDTDRDTLFIPALGGFYDRIAQPLAWVILRLERVAFNQVHLIERNTQHDQRLACPGSCPI